MGAKAVQRVVFLALILDLLAFTIPLPLFPRIIEWYTGREAHDPTGLLNQTLNVVRTVRGWFLSGDSVTDSARKRWDIVLLGGMMGSLFSTLQFIISPFLGRLSDKFGRKRILMLSMIGNILSAIVWLQSTTFASFILARAIGGISEGNVQLSIAILSDVTTPATRGKALSLVGIAFGLCFCVGPPLGAYFASHPFQPTFLNTEFNIYAAPAALSLVLLFIETAFLAAFLPETKGKGALPDLDDLDDANTNATKKGDENTPVVKASPAERLKMLRKLGGYHFLFLALFSGFECVMLSSDWSTLDRLGVEFTLTFLSFDLFDWNNSQNGRLLGFIGVLSTLLQGGYVRRALARTGELRMAQRGIASCVLALGVMASLPRLAASGKQSGRGAAGVQAFYGAAAFLAFTSATVVNSLTAAASLQCDDDSTEGAEKGAKNSVDPRLAKGRALGGFRSSGQLGRALGPLLACAMYWTAGPTITYATSGVLMFILAAHVSRSTPRKIKTL
ncbi:MFS DHA1 sub-family [Clavulina sp. PMI_390]|nr:MFS DHA1 sub-family [Clavulina sp. PMI_390]